MESKDDSALFWDVWLSLYPELGLKTLKRIQTRLESGSYELKNVIPVDVLRRHLDTYTENLKDLVTNLDNKSINKNDNKSGTISKASKSKYYRCHHKKYVKKKPSVLKTTKVSRATSPFISSELLENVLIEELFAKNKNLSLDTKVKISETSCKPSNVQFSNSLPTSCNASEHSSETDPSDAESLDVICSSSSSSDSSKKEESPEGSLDTVIVSRKQHLWCEDCNSRLIQLKKQALKTWIPASKNSSKRKECELLSQIEADLHAKSPSSSSCSSSQCDQCEVCGTSLNHLKHQTLVMVQNLEKARSQHKQQQQEQQAMSTGAVKGVCPSPVLSRIPTARTHSSGKNGVMHDNRSGHYRSQRAQNTSQSPRHEKDVVTKPPPHHSIPSDLPPRKDSPFPQAIATEKFQRERRQRHHHHVQQNAWTVVHGQRAAKQQMLNNNALVSGRSTPVKHSNSGKTKLVTNHKMELTHQDYINENGQMMQPDSGYQVVSPRPSLLPVQYHNHHHHHSNMPVANQQETYYHQYQHHQMVGQEQQHHAHNKNSTAVPGQHYSIPVSHHSQQQQPVVLLSPGGSTSSTGSGTAAAVSFFTRAAQKINLSSKKRKKKEPPEPDPPPFPTNFRHVIGYNPPPVPPGLLRSVPGKLQGAFPAKVKVILRICPVDGHQSGNYIRLDARKKQITLNDPTSYSGYAAPSQRGRHVAPTRLFELDSVFSQDDAMPELCSSALVEIIQSVVNGADGCLFSYGHARVGKTYTMIGVDEGPQNLGIIPCAISWLFRLIEAQKERTGARFSVRVSAVEVTGKQEMLKDLLAHVATSADQYGGGAGLTGGRDKAPGLYLREDPICGTQLENQSELWSPTAEKAAYYLDAAIAARTVPEVEEDARNSHLLFTIHVYQYRVEKGTRSGSGADGVAGGRSRLHVLDLGSCSKSSKDGQSLSLNALGMAILALINGQKHIPHRESKLTQLLRESLGNVGCRTCMIAHVSPTLHAYHETLQVVQLAAKIHRTKRRRKLMSGTSSDDSSSCDGESVRQYRRLRPGIRMGTLREMSHSDPDYTSSSEQSCDTVIYVGPHGHALSDQELTDNERPPTSIPLMPRSTPKIQPRTVPTFSRSKSHSGDESSDAASSVVSQSQGESSRIPKFGENRSPPHKSPVPRSPEHKMVPSSISKPKLGPSPLSYQHSYPGTNTCQNPSVYGPAPLPGYYHHSHSVDETQLSQQSATENCSEQWIDGPMMGPCSNISTDVAPYQKTVQGHYVEAQVVPLSKNPVSQRALNEQWIDGPKEFLVAQATNNAKTEVKEEGKISLLSKSVASRLAVKSGQRTTRTEKSELHTPTVLQNHEHGKADTCKPCEHKAGSKVPIKPFVKDWVEKHSSISSVEAITEDDRSQRSGHSSKSNRNTSSSSGKKASMDEMLYGKQRPSKKETPHSSPKSSVQSGSKSDSHEQNDRMLAWVKTVQDSTDDHVSNDSEGLAEIQRNEIFEGLDNVIADIDQEINEHTNDNNLSPPPTYKVCPVTDTIPEESIPSTDEDGGIEFVVESSNAEHGAVEEETVDNDVTNLLMSNRESIYELQVDAELETSRSSIRNSFHSEDDAWSLGSLPKDCPLDNLLDTKDVDNVEVPDSIDNNNMLIHTLPSSPQVSTLDSGNGTQLDNSFVTVESSRGVISELDTSTGISTMDSRDEKKNFNTIIQGEEELDLVVDASEYNRKNLEDLPSPSDEPQYAVLENTPTRPYSLRRPDGASNPNLSVLCETPKSSNFSSPSEEFVYQMGCGVTNVISPPYLNGGCVTYRERSVIGQSPEEKDGPSEYKKSSQKDSKLSKIQVTTKPPVSFKPSVLPKPSHSKDSSTKSSDKPAVPQRTSSKGSQSSLRKETGQLPSHPSDSSQKTGFMRSHSAPAKTVVSGVKPKEKSFIGSSSPASRPSSAKPAKNSFSSKLPLCSGKRKDVAQSSPTKSSASSSKDSKSSKDSSRSSSKDSKTLKDSKNSSAKDSKNNNLKDVKPSSSSSSSKTRSKSPSPSKRDREKESKLPTSSSIVRYDVYHSKGGESDSGIESGQIRSDRRFLAMSPSSSKRSKPRISMHSTSSGHGSDVSSSFSGHNRMPGKTLVKEVRDVCNSSGYESMLRDSEVTGTSSSHDSTSESGHSDRSSTKIPKKRSILSKRSKSAPAYSNCSTPSSSRHSSPCKKASSPASQNPHPKGWVDTRRGMWESEEPLEIKVYEIEDVERMARRRKEELELRAVAKRRLKIKELLEQQEKLKNDFQHAKSLLMVDSVAWSYDLHVAEQMDRMNRDDPGFLEALEKETEILQKRVDTCKSRIMMVTCFDNTTSTSTVL